MSRRRRRSRRSGGGVSRRRLLVLLGGASITGGLVSSTGAFSSTLAPRQSDVNVTDDTSALLGISLPPYVDAGETGQDLVTVTNNANVPLDVSVDLATPAYGTVSSTTTVAVADDHTFTAEIDEDTPGGPNALVFDVHATDQGTLNIDLTRRVGVRNFLRNLEDETLFDNALFYLSYRLEFIQDFQYYELVVTNLGPERDDLPVRTYTSSDIEHVFRIPTTGTDGGAEGDTYEFDMRIYDSSGLALQRILTDVADGMNPPDNDDIGGAPDDPRVVDFTITDETQFDNGDFTIEYEVENLTNLKEVRVTFDNQANVWADVTETSTDAPTGTVTYEQGGVEGDTYDITVETVNTNDIVTDSLTKTDVADGDDLGGGGGCTIGTNVNPGTLQFNNLQGFSAKHGPDRWEISQVQVQDNDGDNDLNQLKYEITDSGSAVRATMATALSGQQYQAQNITIDPDDPSYDIQKGETYTLTATVCDADGNSNTETRQATA